jgi:hypothetical protein
MGAFDASHGRFIGTRELIGAKVFDTALETVGSVDEAIIARSSGQVEYVVLSCGGFFGLGERHAPVPQEKLRWDPELGGFILNMGKAALEAGPHYSDRGHANWGDPAWVGEIDRYFGVATADGLPA